MTRVSITIDVECREERRVGHRFLPAAGYDLRVWGRFANQRRELGIDLIMSELEGCGLRATFFVDPLGSPSFGEDELASVCQEIRRRGHDVQLHAHPRQAQPYFLSLKEPPLSDQMADYPLDEQVALLRRGLDLLERAGVPRETVVAFRAGHYSANNDTWRAMAQVGLRISSSYNPSHLGKTCRITWPRDETSLFDTGCGVWELPIASFREPRGTPRPLQVSAVSLLEMKDLLMQAHRLEIPHLTLISHSFGLCHIDSVERRTGRLNQITYRRFRGLCRFLGDNDQLFKVETVADLSRDLPLPARAGSGLLLRGRRVLRALRLFEQAYKRLEAELPVDIEPSFGALRRR